MPEVDEVEITIQADDIELSTARSSGKVDYYLKMFFSLYTCRPT